jgi:hypothetical protein
MHIVYNIWKTLPHLILSDCAELICCCKLNWLKLLFLEGSQLIGVAWLQYYTTQLFTVLNCQACRAEKDNCWAVSGVRGNIRKRLVSFVLEILLHSMFALLWLQNSSQYSFVSGLIHVSPGRDSIVGVDLSPGQAEMELPSDSQLIMSSQEDPWVTITSWSRISS